MADVSSRRGSDSAYPLMVASHVHPSGKPSLRTIVKSDTYHRPSLGKVTQILDLFSSQPTGSSVSIGCIWRHSDHIISVLLLRGTR